MKTSQKIKADISSVESKIKELNDSLKIPSTKQIIDRAKRQIKQLKVDVKEKKECLKVIESGITGQTIQKQIERLEVSLKKYKECFTSLTDLATKQGWVKSKEYRKAVSDLKKEFSEPKLNRQLRLAKYMFT